MLCIYMQIHKLQMLLRMAEITKLEEHIKCTRRSGLSPILRLFCPYARPLLPAGRAHQVHTALRFVSFTSFTPILGLLYQA